MTRPTARTARGNRIGLSLTGLVLLAGGGYLLARSLGAFGARQAADPVYADSTVDRVHAARPWLWLIIAALAVVVGILAVRWLLVQLRSDSLSRVVLDSDRTCEPGSGRADLPARAVAGAVGREIDTYPGISGVHAGLAGRPDERELRLRVTVDPDADLPGSAAGSPARPCATPGPRWTPRTCPPNCS
jgi:hypothetical protein